MKAHVRTTSASPQIADILQFWASDSGGCLSFESWSTFAHPLAYPNRGTPQRVVIRTVIWRGFYVRCPSCHNPPHLLEVWIGTMHLLPRV